MQYTTFYLNNQLFGINVIEVQEVTKEMPITPVQLAPEYVSGLINLRGQIATAIHLGILFNLPSDNKNSFMTVVCLVEEELYSFIVGDIGDVLTLDEKDMKPVPENVPVMVKKYINGVYNTPDGILSIIHAKDIIRALNPNNT